MYTTALITLLSTLAIAAPTARQSTAQVFGGMSLRSGSPVHLTEVAASGQRFYLNKPTSAYCPAAAVGETECNSLSNSTLFAANSASDGLSMSVVVPGGQQVYVAADGALGYTIPHSGLIPDGAMTTPFKFTPAAAGQPIGHLEFNGNGFEACLLPNETFIYQIYAAGVPGFSIEGCYGIDFATVAITAEPTAAWEYA
jgi:hypothetical protein